MTKKSVFYKIEVPCGKYCWERNETLPYTSCEYLNNVWGYPTCEMGFSGLRRVEKGILKSRNCLKLKDK